MKVNWNTFIIVAGFSVIGYFGKGAVDDLRSIHDAVLIMRQQVDQMTPKAAFEVQVLEIKSRLSRLEFDMEKLKQGKP